MCKNQLESKMKLYGDTNATLAKALGLSTQRFTAKKNSTHGAEFLHSEIRNIKKRYNLTPLEIDAIFFSE